MQDLGLVQVQIIIAQPLNLLLSLFLVFVCVGNIITVIIAGLFLLASHLVLTHNAEMRAHHLGGLYLVADSRGPKTAFVLLLFLLLLA